MQKSVVKERLTESEKEAGNHAWFKERLNLLDSKAFSYSNTGFGGVSEYKRKRVNYDLYNNIINLKDYEHVCKPFGSEAGELPANMTNRDIISSKVNVLLGMEMKRPFSWKVIAVNEEATTRKEEEEFGRIRDFVTNSVMQPIKQELGAKAQEESRGRKLSEDEQRQVQSKIQEELESATPDKVRRYMRRDHQDPAEALSHQLLEYLILKEDVKMKFNKGWKHGIISGDEIYWVGILNGEPAHRVINSLYYEGDKSPDLEYYQDGEYGCVELRMSPSDVIKYFGDDLTNTDIDDIYNGYPFNSSQIADAHFTFNNDKQDDHNTIRVFHGVWKSLMKIGFLTYMEKGAEEPGLMLVDDTYQLKEEQGDISIEWKWIPRTYEGYRIGPDKYALLRLVPDQYIDLENLFYCPLPFIGASYSNLNSETTSFIDRMKGYQYYYNIIMYRIELLMASDKGKILAANIGAVAKSAGIGIEKFMYFMESSKIAWLNPNEEGNRGSGDVTNMVKEIDMSLASDIKQYIDLAEYIERRCGESVGVPKAMEGLAGPDQSVSNNRQNITQNSHILEPYFELHNNIKRHVLQALVEAAKIAYTKSDKKKLSYVLDDLSVQILNIDQELLENSNYGIFVTNSTKAHEAKEAVQQLAHAAMQSQRADLSDVIKVIRTEGIQEAEELLQASEDRKNHELAQADKAKSQMLSQENEKVHQREMEKLNFQRETEVIVEDKKTDRELQKQAVMSAGFNEDKDMDDDGKLDVVEIAEGEEVNIKRRKQTLDEQKFQHQRSIDKQKIDLEKKKLKNKK